MYAQTDSFRGYFALGRCSVSPAWCSWARGDQGAVKVPSPEDTLAATPSAVARATIRPAPVRTGIDAGAQVQGCSAVSRTGMSIMPVAPVDMFTHRIRTAESRTWSPSYAGGLATPKLVTPGSSPTVAVMKIVKYAGTPHDWETSINGS